MGIQGIRRKFSASGKFCLETPLISVQRGRSLKVRIFSAPNAVRCQGTR